MTALEQIRRNREMELRILRHRQKINRRINICWALIVIACIAAVYSASAPVPDRVDVDSLKVESKYRATVPEAINSVVSALQLSRGSK